MYFYPTMDGATPKLTISARESRSFPIGEYAFSDLAARPSKKSKNAASNTKIRGATGLDEQITAKQPQSRLQQVKVFGMCFLIPIALQR